MIASQSNVSGQVRGSNTIATLHLYISLQLRAQIRQGAINALPVNIDRLVWWVHW